MSVPYQSYYDRLAEWLKEDEFIHVIDYDGNSNFFQITRTERIGQHRILAANAANQIPAGGASDIDPVAFDFLEPPRQNRLYQIRMYVIYTRVVAGGGILAGSMRQIDQADIPPLIEIEWQMPAGIDRGAVDQQKTITVNTIATNIGGGRSGRIPAAMIAFRDDLNETFDFVATYNTFPAFRIVNNDPLLNIGANDGALATLFYLGFMGTKMMIRNVTDAEKQKLLDGVLKFKSVTIGGIPRETTRA